MHSQSHPMSISVSPAKLQIRAAVALTLALLGGHASAQGDCSVGFNCGRVAWGEYLLNAPQSYRLWTQNLDGSQRTELTTFGPSSGNFLQGLTFDGDSKKLYFSELPVVNV